MKNLYYKLDKMRALALKGYYPRILNLILIKYPDRELAKYNSFLDKFDIEGKLKNKPPSYIKRNRVITHENKCRNIIKIYCQDPHYYPVDFCNVIQYTIDNELTPALLIPNHKLYKELNTAGEYRTQRRGFEGITVPSMITKKIWLAKKNASHFSKRIQDMLQSYTNEEIMLNDYFIHFIDDKGLPKLNTRDMIL